MPSGYDLYFVDAYEIRPGKRGEIKAWWEDAEEVFASLPGVIGIEAYASQFGLGGADLEFWTQINDYGALDRWDDAVADDHEGLASVLARQEELLEHVGSRLVGDWPGSQLTE